MPVTQRVILRPETVLHGHSLTINRELRNVCVTTLGMLI